MQSCKAKRVYNMPLCCPLTTSTDMSSMEKSVVRPFIYMLFEKLFIIPSLVPGIMARRRLSVTDDGETCKANETLDLTF